MDHPPGQQGPRSLLRSGTIRGVEGKRFLVHRHRRMVGEYPEMVAQGGPERLVPTKGRRPVPAVEMPAEDGLMGGLVGGILFDQTTPQLPARENPEIQPSQPVSMRDGPIRVPIMGEENSAIPGGRSTTRLHVARLESRRDEALKLGHIGVHGPSRPHPDSGSIQDEGVHRPHHPASVEGGLA